MLESGRRASPRSASSRNAARNCLRLFGAWPLALEAANIALQVLDLVHHSPDSITKGTQFPACLICGFLCAVSEAHCDGDVVTYGSNGAVHSVHPA